MGLWVRGHGVAPLATGRVLRDLDLAEAFALCGRDPVGSVLAASRVQDAALASLALVGGELWGYPDVGPLTAICWSGANIVPVVPDGDPLAIAAFARLARQRGRRASSIVGPARDVLALWRELAPTWASPREIRPNQPSMVLRDAARAPADPLTTVATADDFSILLAASIDMFTEEVGYSPVAMGGASYAARVRSLIDAGRTFAHFAEMPAADGAPQRTVVFKADVGASTAAVAQVQGVWVAPALRGRGHSVGGMAAVAQQMLRQVPCISLYVNHHNTHAIAAYRHVGFEQVGTYATVLF